MGLRALLVLLAAVLLVSAGGAQLQPAPPAQQRLGRPVLQPPGVEERQTGVPAGGQQPGGPQQPASRRLGRPVLTVPSPGAGGTPRQATPPAPHRTTNPNASREGRPR